MKKYIIAPLAAILFMYSADGRISEGAYLDYADKNKVLYEFWNDLTPGFLLTLDSDLLKAIRFYSHGNYYNSYGAPTGSVDDSFSDPLARLVKELLPSVGATLNLDGTGSLQKVMKDSNKYGNHAKFVVELLRQAYRYQKATSAQRNEINSKALTALGAKAGCDNDQNSQLSKKVRAIWAAVSEAILCEEPAPCKKDEVQQSARKTYVYPNGLVAGVLKYYAVQALDDGDLDQMALDEEDSAQVTKSKEGPTTNIPHQIKDLLGLIANTPAWHPFPSGTQISNGEAYYKNKKQEKLQYADCCETMIRQFIALLLYSEKDADANSTLARIKNLFGDNADGNKLYDFISKECNGNLKLMVTDGTEKTRTAWSDLIVDLKGVEYQFDGYNMRSSWVNIVRSVCHLLRDFNPKCLPSDATEAQKAEYNKKVKKAKETIGGILDGKETVTPENLKEIIQTLLDGLRSDVTLTVEGRGEEEENKIEEKESGVICGEVTIANKQNKLTFDAAYGHAHMDDVKEKVWIEKMNGISNPKFIEEYFVGQKNDIITKCSDSGEYKWLTLAYAWSCTHDRRNFLKVARAIIDSAKEYDNVSFRGIIRGLVTTRLLCEDTPFTVPVMNVITDDIIKYNNRVAEAKKNPKNDSLSPEGGLKNEKERFEKALVAFNGLLEFQLYAALFYAMKKNTLDNIDYVDFFSKIVQIVRNLNGGSRQYNEGRISIIIGIVASNIKASPDNEEAWKLALAILAAADTPESRELLISIADAVAAGTAKSHDILKGCKNPVGKYTPEELKIVTNKILPNIRTLQGFVEAILEVEKIITNKGSIARANAKGVRYTTTIIKEDFLLEAWNMYLTDRATTNSWWTVDEMKALMDQSQNKSLVVNMFSSILKQIQSATKGKNGDSLLRYGPILVKIFDLVVGACGDDVTGVGEVFNYLPPGKRARDCLIGTVLKSKDSSYVNALRSYVKEHFHDFSLKE